jgi:hypothetical protein
MNAIGRTSYVIRLGYFRCKKCVCLNADRGFFFEECICILMHFKSQIILLQEVHMS